jgi:hypothetical protein
MLAGVESVFDRVSGTHWTSGCLSTSLDELSHGKRTDVDCRTDVHVRNKKHITNKSRLAFPFVDSASLPVTHANSSTRFADSCNIYVPMSETSTQQISPWKSVTDHESAQDARERSGRGV